MPDSAGLDLSRLRDRCAALKPILGTGQFFSRRTAAALWRIPVPKPSGDLIEVGSFHPLRAPRRPEVTGHRVRAGILYRAEVDGLPTPSVADIWCLLAAVLGRNDLVIAGDAVLTPQRRFGAGGGRYSPLADLNELVEAVERHRGGAGTRLREQALPMLRSPVDSPPETLLRLLIVDAGFPEPLVNCPVRVSGRVLHSDLGYPQLKIAIEYEGGYHFAGGHTQARRDVQRWEAMHDARWRVLRVTALDLQDPCAFLARLAAAIQDAAGR